MNKKNKKSKGVDFDFCVYCWRTGMIVYTPFWKTIEKRNVSTYKLIKDYNISSSTINRLRHNQPVSTSTIDTLCELFDCDIKEIVEFKK